MPTRSAPNVRAPAVAGRFYPSDRVALEEALDEAHAIAGAEAPSAAGAPTPAPVLGVVAPHAGYLYSGAVAASVFARAEIPRRVVVLGPNHTGLGPPVSIYPAGGVWRMPQGDVPIDRACTEALCTALPDLVAEEEAHRYEHAVEVELPFLQRRRPDLQLTAIILATRDAASVRRLGEALAATLEAAGEPILLVASTDMNHFEDHDTTLAKDRLALERVAALDPDGLLATCKAHAVSMCGVAPTAAVLHALRPRGLTRARLIWHRTSGDVDGRRTRVVGYAGLLLEGAR